VLTPPNTVEETNQLYAGTNFWMRCPSRTSPTYRQPLYDQLLDAGHDVRLAHPQKVKAVAEAKIKTDKIDSETLAHLLRAGLLPESYVPPRDIRELRDLVRRRAFLVGMRTKLKNRVHAELAKRDNAPGTPLFTKRGRALLLEEPIIVFDEFTSVVDREVAKVSSFAIQKAVRRTKKKFIAVTCHYDIIDYLEPDWVLCTDDMSFSKKKLGTLPLQLRSGHAAYISGITLKNITI